MFIFNVLPKKTLLLVLALGLILIFLVMFLFSQNKTGQKNENPQLQPTIPVAALTPASRQIPVFRTAPNNINQSGYKIAFNIPEGFSLPQTIENIEVRRNIDESYVSFLKDRFEFQGNPQASGSLYFWLETNNNRSLQINIDTGFIQYNSGDNQLSQQQITSLQAVKIAEDFLNSLNVVSITPNTQSVIMLAGEGELFETQNESLAQFYEISYIQSYRGTPIYYHFASPASISVLVDRYGNVRSLKYFHIQPVKTLSTTFISLDQAKQRVEKGEYTIVNISGDPATTPTTGTITINSAAAIHFDDKKNPTFFPTILFEGVLQPSNREVKIYFSVLSN